MSGDLSQHHLSFTSSYVLVHNHARVDVFNITSFPSLSWDSWRNPAALELPQRTRLVSKRQARHLISWAEFYAWFSCFGAGLWGAIGGVDVQFPKIQLIVFRFGCRRTLKGETNYTKSVGRNGVIVSRSKDLLACTGRNGQHSAPILSTPYSSASSIQSLLR